MHIPNGIPPGLDGQETPAPPDKDHAGPKSLGPGELLLWREVPMFRKIS